MAFFEAFKLPAELQARIAAQRAIEQETRAAFACLSDVDLVIAARHWLSMCESPRRIEPEQPVYDSTFWHAILPELLKRLEQKEPVCGPI